jgi:DNA mismatch endonuclease, patch repair protein
MDTVDKLTRSKIMASVGQKDTGVELLVRKALHRIGLRYRLHVRSLPGSPDLVFPRFRAAVFVHGCYWHFHECHRSSVPQSQHDFWLTKFETNRSRDKKNMRLLIDKGWRVLTIWECAVRGKTAVPTSEIAAAVKAWLDTNQTVGDIEG